MKLYWLRGGSVQSFLLAGLFMALLAACGPSGKIVQDPPEPAPTRERPTPPARKEPIKIVFTYGSEKQDWVKEITATFNASGAKTSSGAPIMVEAIPTGSGDCIDELLSGSRKAHLTSPASAAFIKLGNSKSRAQTGKDLIAATDNLLLSPVVIAMWKPMAESLGWGKRPVGWGEILALARDPQGWGSKGQAQWGAFKFGHTHPEYSNSGLIAVLAEVYAGAGKLGGLDSEDLQKEGVRSYVRDIEAAVVHYGESTGFFGKKMFANGPAFLSAAVLYENMVIESYSQTPPPDLPVVAIYPKEGTFWSDHPVGIVERDWVTAEHREAAKQYIAYALARPQQEKAIPRGFRPALPEIALGAPFDSAHGVDAKEPKTTLEVPNSDITEGTLKLWRENKKRAHVTLVLDTSGSMKGERIQNARAGSLQLLSSLNDSDNFSFLPFSSSVAFAFKGVRLKDERPRAQSAVEGVFAEGGTALYDAVSQAFEHQMNLSNQAEAGIIHAVVVLTDGEDTNSRMKLPGLIQKIRSDTESRKVRVFTIGYGGEANEQALRQIADATQAKYYKGTPQNIRAVFREIATFF